MPAALWCQPQIALAPVRGKAAPWVVPLTGLASFSPPTSAAADTFPDWITSERSNRSRSRFTEAARRDADLILKLLVENRFPSIWVPSQELRDLRALLRHRHQWVRMRTRTQNALQSMALANALRRSPYRWSQAGQQAIASLPLAPHTADRRRELQATYAKFEAEIVGKGCSILGGEPHTQNLVGGDFHRLEVPDSTTPPTGS
jgi:hypothetical protein